MRIFRKITAIALVVIMAISFAGCSLVPKTASAEWGYKTASQEYPIGVHIYSLFSAYNQAYSVISGEQGEDFDSTASILAVESTFDEANGTEVCRDWVIKEADSITRNLIGLDNAISEYGIELSEDVLDSAYEQARKDWYLGAYYEEYAAYGYSATPYQTMLEPFGVSFDSFYYSTYLAGVKQNALFDYMYAKGGIYEVSESEVKDYFEDNYTSYSYFSVNLYETTTDGTTGQSVNTALADDKIADIKENLELYVKMFKNGTSFDDIADVYTAYAELDNDPSINNIENLDNTSLGAEVAAAIDGLKEGTASIVYVGEGNTQVAYFICKHSIAKETKEYVSSDTNFDALLQEMKGDEFLEYAEGLTDTVECETNDSIIAKFTPEIFEDNLG